MRSKPQNQITLFLILTGIFLSLNCVGQNCQPQKIDFTKNEAAIDMSIFIKPHAAVYEEQKKFKEHFKKSPQVDVDLTPDTIVANVLISDMYIRIKNKMKTDPKCKSKGCMAAIRITYGLDGTKIKHLYQPLYLFRADSTSSVYDTVRFDANFYLYKRGSVPGTGKFIITSSKAYVNTYINNIQIKQHPNDNIYKPHRPMIDSKSVIFSFQEIMRFYDNEFKNEDTDKHYCQELAVHNGCSFLTDPCSTDKTARHTIFFTAYDWQKKSIPSDNALMLNSSGDGANLAHLCPPSCNALIYPLQ